LELEKKNNSTLKVIDSAEVNRPGGLPLSIVTYSSKAKDGDTWYMVRGFLAARDTCGDLEFYTKKPISAQDSDIDKVFSTYALDDHYAPKFVDAFVYAQTLYRDRMYKAAGPVFEGALAKLTNDPGPLRSVETARRVATDQAGMSYGIAGNSAKAHSIFEKAIAQDPDYAMYYYNLACADAADKNLRDARIHLQAAFERRANVIPGESLPDPTKDDSFLPFKGNRDFWKFLEQLQASR
jgi:tetratricopeptide (TPR) repeat protein